MTRPTFARVGSKSPFHIPALAAATVMCKGLRTVCENGPKMLLEPTTVPLLGGLVVVPTLVGSEKHLFPVQVMNLSDEDVWLNSKTRLGVLMPVDSVKSDEICEVQFKRIATDVDEVSISKPTDSPADVQSVLDELNVDCKSEQKAKLDFLLNKFSFVFATEDEDLGYADKVQHEIHLTDDMSVTQPYRRIPPTQYREVRDHIGKLLKKGVIQESSS